MLIGLWHRNSDGDDVKHVKKDEKPANLAKTARDAAERRLLIY
jgi:hypothetical protein